MVEPKAADELLRTLVLFLGLAGTFAFALSGATAGIRRQLDLFAVLVLSFAAATSGGIARDLLIGAVPPAARIDRRSLTVPVAAAVLCFFCSSLIERLRNPVRPLAAVSLALLAGAG